VVLTGVLPEHSEDGSPVKGILEVRIFRLDRALTPQGYTLAGKSAQRTAFRQFNKEARRVATLSGDNLEKALAGRRLTYIDPQPVATANTENGSNLTYAMTVVDVVKRSSQLSRLTEIRVLSPPLPPSNLRAEMSEKHITIRWEPPSPQGGREPAGYNVYRAEREGRYPERPRNERPLTQLFFEEEGFEFDRTYSYVVRSVAGEPPRYRESEDSVPLAVNAHDVYPPAVPTGLAVSAEEGVMKLYWFPNNETDLAGYRIYRSERETEGFELIGEAGPADTTYVDKTLRTGIKYYYSVTAVDRATPPNESDRSEAHGDRLPPSREAPPKPRAPERP